MGSKREQCKVATQFAHEEKKATADVKYQPIATPFNKHIVGGMLIFIVGKLPPASLGLV